MPRCIIPFCTDPVSIGDFCKRHIGFTGSGCSKCQKFSPFVDICAYCESDHLKVVLGRARKVFTGPI